MTEQPSASATDPESAATASPLPPPPAKSNQRRWAPKIWLGGTCGVLWQLLARNRFQMGWRQWPIALADLIISPFNSGCALIERARYGRQIEKTTLAEPPLFILGHWRTGTTLLHEMLICDPRHAFPNTYQCFAPGQHLSTEWLAHRWLQFLVPSRRPMDNMATGWSRPQEDEFALCNLGEHSPYLTIAFPNRGYVDQEYLDLESLPAADRERWKQTLLRFLKSVALRAPEKRLVLKSPTHTCRIATLLEMFPDARFVHIVRDPYVVYASTMKLWPSLYRAHGYQTFRGAGLEEHVLETFQHMYRKLEAGRRLVPKRRFCEIKYEDLVADPIGQVRSIYDQIDLGDFETARGPLEAYCATISDYQTNRHEVDPDTRRRVRAAWGEVIDRYGYDDDLDDDSDDGADG
ncbi:MAG: sulfotransferase [Planctomycetales bacterium]|nr:sulfotransferase [Planctomycetales bacterium]